MAIRGQSSGIAFVLLGDGTSNSTDIDLTKSLAAGAALFSVTSVGITNITGPTTVTVVSSSVKKNVLTVTFDSPLQDFTGSNSYTLYLVMNGGLA